jgi:hypothetical protein
MFIYVLNVGLFTCHRDFCHVALDNNYSRWGEQNTIVNKMFIEEL